MLQEIQLFMYVLNDLLVWFKYVMEIQWVFVVDVVYELCMLLMVLCLQVQLVECVIDEQEWCVVFVDFKNGLECVIYLVYQLFMLVCQEFDVMVFVEVDLWVLLGSVVGDLFLVVEYGGIDFGLLDQGDDGCLLCVQGNVDVLCIFFNNLVDNVLCYILVGGVVDVGFEFFVVGRCVVVIQDSGFGIVESELLCVFDCFYWVQCVQEQGFLCGVFGSGLGLVIVCQIVDLYWVLVELCNIGCGLQVCVVFMLLLV